MRRLLAIDHNMSAKHCWLVLILLLGSTARGDWGRTSDLLELETRAVPWVHSAFFDRDLDKFTGSITKITASPNDIQCEIAIKHTWNGQMSASVLHFKFGAPARFVGLGLAPNSPVAGVADRKGIVRGLVFTGTAQFVRRRTNDIQVILDCSYFLLPASKDDMVGEYTEVPLLSISADYVRLVGNRQVAFVLASGQTAVLSTEWEGGWNGAPGGAGGPDPVVPDAVAAAEEASKDIREFLGTQEGRVLLGSGRSDGLIGNMMWQMHAGEGRSGGGKIVEGDGQRLDLKEGDWVFRVSGIEAPDTLNLRKAPGAHNGVVARVPPEAKSVRITGDKVTVGADEWVPVRWRDHEGWVNKKFLDVTPAWEQSQSDSRE